MFHCRVWLPDSIVVRCAATQHICLHSIQDTWLLMQNRAVLLELYSTSLGTEKQHVLLSATRRYPLWMMFRHCLYPQFGLVLAVETLRCFSIRHPFRNQRLTNHHCQFPQSSINWSSMKHHIPKSSAMEGAGLSSLTKPLNSWQPTPRRAKALWLFPELDPLLELLNSLVQMQFIYCMYIYTYI